MLSLLSCNLRTLVVGMVVALGATSGMPNSLLAAPPTKADAVGLFKAIKNGDVDARVVVKNSREAQLMLRNRTSSPVSVQLPSAFGASPVLAQTGTPTTRSSSSSSSSNSNQSIGGGGMGGSTGGFFSIPPEKETKIKLTTVCLEHGKKDPSPVVKYELQPIDKLATDPAVRELLAAMSAGKVPQHVAQAAAWHLNSNLSWEELAAKKVDRVGRPDTPYFSQAELVAAQQAVSMARSAAAHRAATEAQEPKEEPAPKRENPEVRPR